MTIARQTSIDDVLEGRGHDVTVVNRGEQCLKTYSEQLTIVRDSPARTDMNLHMIP